MLRGELTGLRARLPRSTRSCTRNCTTTSRRGSGPTPGRGYPYRAVPGLRSGPPVPPGRARTETPRSSPSSSWPPPGWRVTRCCGTSTRTTGRRTSGSRCGRACTERRARHQRGPGAVPVRVRHPRAAPAELETLADNEAMIRGRAAGRFHARGRHQGLRLGERRLRQDGGHLRPAGQRPSWHMIIHSYGCLSTRRCRGPGRICLPSSAQLIRRWPQPWPRAAPAFAQVCPQ